jgi:arylsulfatase A-like enzyme
MKKNLKTILPLLVVFALASLLLFINSPPPANRTPADINVILLTIDSIRPDHLGCYGYTRETSPTIDGIAENGVLFQNAFSQSVWTIPGIMSILTSLQPAVHGVEQRGDTLDPAITTMLDCFRESGYAVPNICFLLTIPEFATIRVGAPEEEYYSAEDDDELLRWLDDNHDSKFFAWFHHRSVHLPYKTEKATREMFLPVLPPEEELSSGMRAVLSDAAVVPIGTAEFEEGDRQIMEGLYDAEVKKLDNFVGRLHAKLREHGLLEKTLIVITADHGEELLDHGFVGHASTMRSATLYDEVMRIPFIISLGNHLPSGRKIHEQVQQIDVMPTILDIAGIPMPTGIQGRSLAPVIFSGEDNNDSSMPVFVETVYGGYQATEEMARTYWRCVRTDEWKLIEIDEPAGKSFRLYDLLNDPKELVDVFGEDPQPLGDMQAWLAIWKQQNEVRRKAIASDKAAVVSAGYDAECPEFTFPHEAAILDFEEGGGKVRASWTGDLTLPYVVEYDVGKGIYHVTGSFAVSEDSRDFGPYSREMWKALVVRNPWRVRVSPDVQPRCWSDWIEFNFE